MKTMKKLFMMMLLMAVPFALQAQSKFHDVEANEAKGPVKVIKQSIMGQEQVVNFTENGKMQRDGLKDASYDADGYLQSAVIEAMGQTVKVVYAWENGRVKSQTVNVMGQAMKSEFQYDDKGVVTGTSVDMGGQKMSTPFTDYKYDDHGNWISRKTTVMGQTVEQARTIEYYK